MRQALLQIARACRSSIGIQPGAAPDCAPKHRLNTVICGDALQELSAIGDGDQFDVVIADPPYNIKKDFGNNNDNMELADYTEWCRQWMAQCLRLVKPDAPVFI